MPRIAVGIEYDGRCYSGWQQQASAPSVQAALQSALGFVADHPVSCTAAGRTDAGVHALGQVAHFDTSSSRSPRSWLLGANSRLPADIAVQWAVEVPEHFHARYSATARTYQYLICNRGARSALAAGRALLVHQPLDAPLMNEAAQALLGEHDFSAFRAAECQAKSAVRRLQELTVRRRADWLLVTATANAFLHHMVRNLVGVLLEVGRGDAPPRRALEQLQSRQRSTGAATADACGLYFRQAHYPPQFGLPGPSAMIGAWS